MLWLTMVNDLEVEQLIHHLCQAKENSTYRSNAKPEAQLVCLVPNFQWLNLLVLLKSELLWVSFPPKSEQVLHFTYEVLEDKTHQLDLGGWRNSCKMGHVVKNIKNLLIHQQPSTARLMQHRGLSIIVHMLRRKFRSLMTLTFCSWSQ